MSYEVQILVNGSRCKQYYHNGKTFIEAKKGSEYSLEIKNNTWQRILAVCSVDGLDVLNGKPATENGNGYVITGYNSLKIDGFRVSDNEVAKFLFDYKGSSYAASKEDGSERNVGVIAARIFAEKIQPPPPPPVVIKEEHHHHHHHDHYPDYWWNRPWWNGTTNSPTIWNDGLTRQSDITYGCSNNSTLSNAGGETLCSDAGIDQSMASDSLLYERDMSKGIRGRQSPKAAFQNQIKAMNCCGTKGTQAVNNVDILRGFDMGTKWGEAKESRVIEVEFEKGILSLSTNIYYASRQSLIEMGIPLGNEKQVSFPEPFKDSKYAEPPKGWTKRY
jgi:hypothetical protein